MDTIACKVGYVKSLDLWTIRLWEVYLGEDHHGAHLSTPMAERMEDAEVGIGVSSHADDTQDSASVNPARRLSRR